MGRLIYAALASLDGRVADEAGDFSFAEPDAEVHAAVNAVQRRAGTLLLGRRMYEVLSAWETMDTTGQPPAIAEFAGLWRDQDKVVVSRTLARPATARTRIEPTFDPAAVRRWKADSARDLVIGGPTLAAEAFRAGLVDEVHLFLAPVLVGGGLRALPEGVRHGLRLASTRAFEGGFVHLAYERGAPS